MSEPTDIDHDEEEFTENTLIEAIETRSKATTRHRPRPRSTS